MLCSMYKPNYNPITILWRNLIWPQHVLMLGPDLVLFLSQHNLSPVEMPHIRYMHKTSGTVSKYVDDLNDMQHLLHM